MLINLAYKSLLHRKGSIILTIITISVSIIVMLAVDHIRQQAKLSFSSSVSGVDLIVGTRTGSLNLLLYSVFRTGTPTNNISWTSYERISQKPTINHAIPISLGDSHQGYRVMGTTANYFEYFTYSNKQQLAFAQGHKFEHIFDLVLGAKVAKTLGYQLGDSIILSHGIGRTSFKNHDSIRFNVVGILAATGTPVDQTLHTSLQGLEAAHLTKPADIKRLTQTAELTLSQVDDLKPKSITAIMLMLKSKMAVFTLQREINTDKQEPLSAILPGVALSELWQTMAVFDNTLHFITILVIISSLIGLNAILLASIRERIHEITLLRMVGASAGFIFLLIELEAIVIVLLSTTIALVALSFLLPISQTYVLNHYGILIDSNIISKTNIELMFYFFIFTVIAAIPSALSAYKGARNSHV